MGIERQVIQLTECQVERFHGFSSQLLCCQTPAGTIKNFKTSRASIVIIRQPLVLQSTCPSPKCCWNSYGKLSSDRRWKSSSRLPVDRSTAMLRARTASIGAWWVTCGQNDFSSLALCLRERPWLEATASPVNSSCRWEVELHYISVQYFSDPCSENKVEKNKQIRVLFFSDF